MGVLGGVLVLGGLVGTTIEVHVDPRRPAEVQTPGELRVAGTLGWAHLACGLILVVTVLVAAVVAGSTVR